MAKYYEQRASAGLIVTEATAISEEGYGWLNAPEIRTPEQVKAWRNVTDKVHNKNGHIYVQLWHMGRQSHSSFHPKTNRIVAPSSIPLPSDTKVKNTNYEAVDPEVPHALTVDEVNDVIQDYVKAALLAKEADFDGIELHAANGYLIDLFLQSTTNQRTDEYGGSFENRTRLLTEIIDGIVKSGAFPANRIGVRISPNGVFGGMGSADNKEMFQYVAKALNKYGLSYLHVMDGLGFGFHNLGEAVTCADIRKYFDSAIISNVGLTKEIAEGMVRSGAADLVAFGRLYISNPDLPERFANDWPLAETAGYEHWWGHTGEKGYTDWPTYEEASKKSNKSEAEPEEKKEE